jgi:AcrR family transcriptional regulator
MRKIDSSSKTRRGSSHGSVLSQQKLWLVFLYGRGLTTEHIARELRVSPRSVRAWFNKKSVAQTAVLKRLRRFYHDQARLAEQSRYVQALLDRGWTRASIGVRCKAKPETISSWLEERAMMRPSARAILRQLYDSGEVPPKTKVVSGYRGPLDSKQKQKRDQLERKYKLYTPEDRARRIRGLAKKFKITLRDLARLLNIDYKTMALYAKPSHTGHIAPVILEKLIQLIKLDRISWPAMGNRFERFDQLAQRLFGPYYQKGIPGYSPEHKRALDVLEALTHYSRRTLYKYLPPYGRRKLNPPITLLEEFESIVDLLEPTKNIVNSKKLQRVIEGDENGGTDDKSMRQRVRRIA